MSQGTQPQPPPIDPSQLLLGLPALACECLLQHLVQAGSKQLTELMRCSRVTRNLVLQHAPDIIYTVRRDGKHNALHAVASRSSDLNLTLNIKDSQATAQLLMQAFQHRQEGNEVRGWSAVRKLSLQDNTGVVESVWQHLVGPAVPRLRQLEVQDMSLTISFFLSLHGFCPELEYLEMSYGNHVSVELERDAALLPACLPKLTALDISHRHPELLSALGPQLRSLELQDWGHLASSANLRAALARCTQLQKLHMFTPVDDEILDTILQLPTVREVHFHSIQLERSHASHTATCSWTHVKLNEAAAAATLAALPSMPQLEQLDVAFLSIGPSTSVQAASKAAALLAGLAAAGKLSWGGEQCMLLEFDMPEPDAEGELDADVAASIHAAVAALSPLNGCIQRLWCGVKDHEVLQWPMGAAQLKTLGQALGSGLLELDLDGADIAAGFWPALLPNFPELSSLSLIDQEELSAEDLVLFCTSNAQRPFTIELFDPQEPAEAAVEEVQQQLAAQGVDSLVKLQITEDSDGRRFGEHGGWSSDDDMSLERESEEGWDSGSDWSDGNDEGEDGSVDEDDLSD